MTTSTSTTNTTDEKENVLTADELIKRLQAIKREVSLFCLENKELSNNKHIESILFNCELGRNYFTLKSIAKPLLQWSNAYILNNIGSNYKHLYGETLPKHSLIIDNKMNSIRNPMHWRNRGWKDKNIFTIIGNTPFPIHNISQLTINITKRRGAIVAVAKKPKKPKKSNEPNTQPPKLSKKGSDETNKSDNIYNDGSTISDITTLNYHLLYSLQKNGICNLNGIITFNGAAFVKSKEILEKKDAVPNGSNVTIKMNGIIYPYCLSFIVNGVEKLNIQFEDCYDMYKFYPCFTLAGAGALSVGKYEKVLLPIDVQIAVLSGVYNNLAIDNQTIANGKQNIQMANQFTMDLASIIVSFLHL